VLTSHKAFDTLELPLKKGKDDMPNNTNLAPLKAQVTKLSNRANDLTVENDVQMSEANNILSDLKKVKKQITSRKEEITKPLNEALKSARALFKPVEDDFETAERIIKDKMLDYHTEQERLREEAEAKIEARREKGTLRDETADRKLGELDEVEKTVASDKGATTFKTVRKVRITDVSLVPKEYLQNDKVMDAILTAVRKDALEGYPIAGVEVYDDKQVANR